jgi:hypothetical protein
LFHIVASLTATIGFIAKQYAAESPETRKQNTTQSNETSENHTGGTSFSMCTL